MVVVGCLRVVDLLFCLANVDEKEELIEFIYKKLPNQAEYISVVIREFLL